jgi:hypothetical protein
MASRASHRQTVVPLIDAVMPWSITRRASSRVLYRDKGTRLLLGNSHARAFTATTTRGGKTGRSPGACFIEQPGQAFFVKAFSPLTDNRTWQIEARCDLLILESFGRVQDNLGSNHFEIR